MCAARSGLLAEADCLLPTLGICAMPQSPYDRERCTNQVDVVAAFGRRVLSSSSFPAQPFAPSCTVPLVRPQTSLPAEQSVRWAAVLPHMFTNCKLVEILLPMIVLGPYLLNIGQGYSDGLLICFPYAVHDLLLLPGAASLKRHGSTQCGARSSGRDKHLNSARSQCNLTTACQRRGRCRCTSS